MSKSSGMVKGRKDNKLVESCDDSISLRKSYKLWPVNLYIAIFYGDKLVEEYENIIVSPKHISDILLPMVDELPEISRDVLLMRYKEQITLKSISIEKKSAYKPCTRELLLLKISL